MTNKALMAQLKGKMKSRKEAGDDVWLDLERAAAALEAQEWQPIGTMPFGEHVLVCFNDGTMESHKRSETVKEFRSNILFESRNSRTPKYWRPRPPAPEGE